MRGGIMRLLHILALLLIWPLMAGAYYHGQTDIYDPVTGFYYRTVGKEAGERGLMSSKTAGSGAANLNIFDPATNTSTLLFKEPQDGGIVAVLFETGYKDGSIEFNNSDATRFVLNNTAV